MDVSLPPRFLLLLANSTDPERRDAFERWCSEVHVPNVAATHGIAGGRLYRLATRPREGQGQFILLFEIEPTDDYRSLDRRLLDSVARERDAGGSIGLIRPLFVGFYQRIVEVAPAVVSELPADLWRAFLLVFTNCTDPGRLAEYDRWYTDVHVPDMLEVPALVRGARYRTVRRPRPEQVQFVAFYATTSADYRGTFEEIRTLLERKRAQGRIIDCLEHVTSGFYTLVSDYQKSRA